MSSSGCITTSVGSYEFCFVVVPIDILNPNTYNKVVTMTLIKINGSNTNIHEIIPKFFSHNTFNNKVIMIVTINFIIAVLYNPKYMSINI